MARDCRQVPPSAAAVDLGLTDPPYRITYRAISVLGPGTQPITNDGTRVSLRLYRAVIPMLRGANALHARLGRMAGRLGNCSRQSMKVEQPSCLGQRDSRNGTI